MVKVLIDCWDERVSEKALEFKDCLLIITNKCTISPEVLQYYSQGQDIDDAVRGGNYFFQTSDDFQRGLIIGKILSRIPGVVIYSSRPEVIRKYIGSAGGIEEWSARPMESEEFTLKGPELLPNNPYQIPLDKRASEPVGANKIPNIPKYPELSPNAGFVEPISPEKGRPVKPEFVSPQSSSKFIAEKPNPLLGRASEVQRNKEAPVVNSGRNQISIEKRPYEDKIPRVQSASDNDRKVQSKPVVEQPRLAVPQKAKEIPQEYVVFSNQHIGSIVSHVLDSKELSLIKTLSDLYGIILRKIREICEQHQILEEDDDLRSYLNRFSQKTILDLGFFSIPHGRTIDDIVDSCDYKTELLYNTS